MWNSWCIGAETDCFFSPGQVTRSMSMSWCVLVCQEKINLHIATNLSWQNAKLWGFLAFVWKELFS